MMLWPGFLVSTSTRIPPLGPSPTPYAPVRFRYPEIGSVQGSVPPAKAERTNHLESAADGPQVPPTATEPDSRLGPPGADRRLDRPSAGRAGVPAARLP